MAIAKCKECGKEVSTDATVCPHCGKPNPTYEEVEVTTKEVLKAVDTGCSIAVLVFLSIIIVFWVSSILFFKFFL